MTSRLKIQVEVENRPEKTSKTSKPHLKKDIMISHQFAV
jgi:hypothetical protein